MVQRLDWASMSSCYLGSWVQNCDILVVEIMRRSIDDNSECSRWWCLWALLPLITHLQLKYNWFAIIAFGFFSSAILLFHFVTSSESGFSQLQMSQLTAIAILQPCTRKTLGAGVCHSLFKIIILSWLIVPHYEYRVSSTIISC